MLVTIYTCVQAKKLSSNMDMWPDLSHFASLCRHDRMILSDLADGLVISCIRNPAKHLLDTLSTRVVCTILYIEHIWSL